MLATGPTTTAARSGAAVTGLRVLALNVTVRLEAVGPIPEQEAVLRAASLADAYNLAVQR